jgi:hypothetical protein
MGKLTSKVKSVKTPMLPELSDDNKRSLFLPQVQANNQANKHSMRDRSTPTPGNKHLRHQLPLSSGATMTHLVPIDYVHETSSGTSSAMDLKFITRRKPTWEPLLPL